ncbi:MAG: carboxylesterase family protein [Ketobacteraceae bacterium]|nr:carboxylesterase family protein [Ketobacteraceae bacterium]
MSVRSICVGYWRLTLIMLALAALSACRISGHVSVDGNPVAGQTVILEGEGLSLSTRTDADGDYSFNRIDAGLYHISLDRPGMTNRRIEKPTDQGSVRMDFTVNTRTLRRTTQGDVLGSTDSNGTLVWKGIPFARAPENGLRWKAARPAESWEGDYWALGFSNPCPQIAHLQLDVPLTKIGSVIGQEDCLYLNVWTPDFDNIPQGDERPPVMFWIHGGGNAAGESASFTGKMLAEKYGVVVVTTNYRLGVLGFFSHPALRESATQSLDQTANFAITDLVRSLTWVQENISAFGGNPERVMIFGESAGAANVAALLASPLAQGLFHRAAMQSGNLRWMPRTGAENLMVNGGSENSARELISKFLVADGTAASIEDAHALQQSMSHQALLEYLNSKTIDELLAHFDASRFGMYSHPGLIRDGIVVPDQDPYAFFRRGNYHQVPIITGTNRDETKIFMAFNPEFVPGGLPIFIKDPVYFNLSAYYQSTAWRARAVDEFAAAAAGQNNPVYTYRFDWDEQPKILWNDVSDTIGAAHAFEIPFVFNTPDIFTVKIASPLVFTPSTAVSRQQLADSMSSYWAEFAYSGNPGFGYADSEAVPWDHWTENQEETNIMLFDSTNDGGIRMQSDRVSLDSLRLELQQESGFRNLSQKCTTYESTFGRDSWYYTHCADVL